MATWLQTIKSNPRTWGWVKNITTLLIIIVGIGFIAGPLTNTASSGVAAILWVFATIAWAVVICVAVILLGVGAYALSKRVPAYAPANPAGAGGAAAGSTVLYAAKVVLIALVAIAVLGLIVYGALQLPVVGTFIASALLATTGGATFALNNLPIVILVVAALAVPVMLHRGVALSAIFAAILVGILIAMIAPGTVVSLRSLVNGMLTTPTPDAFNGFQTWVTKNFVLVMLIALAVGAIINGLRKGTMFAYSVILIAFFLLWFFGPGFPEWGRGLWTKTDVTITDIEGGEDTSRVTGDKTRLTCGESPTFTVSSNKYGEDMILPDYNKTPCFAEILRGGGEDSVIGIRFNGAEEVEWCYGEEIPFDEAGVTSIYSIAFKLISGPPTVVVVDLQIKETELVLK